MNTPPDAIRTAMWFAPAESDVQFSEAEHLAIDNAMLRDKQRDGYGRRNQDNAMRLQLQDQDNQETKA